MSEWKDIETAPRDGTEIVMLDAISRTATVGHWMVDKSWMQSGLAGEGKFFPSWFPLHSPSHWIPLPALPEGAK